MSSLKKYEYHSISDTLKEPVSSGLFENKDTAYEFFAQLKQMPIKSFKSLFIVEKSKQK